MQPHSLQIPVMGTGFTIDTPLKVARYGISSVMSVDDNLMEKMREYYCNLYHEPFSPIAKSADDSRALRITAYLNFVGKMVKKQIEELKLSPFEEGAEITKYFELLDERSDLKQQYNRMLSTQEETEKIRLQSYLRENVTAGSIDVNILTKLDREGFKNGQKLSREYSDGLSALRGYAQSDLNSSIIFSAGLNPYLYTYVENFEDFYADAQGVVRKKIIIKVSDFRSAFIQGKIFAKKGIWVSEFRIESGLNCGGHAFPTAGYLLGPILEEFKNKKEEFTKELFDYYRPALAAKKGIDCLALPSTRITVQGGIGTSQEHQFLLRYYQLDGAGWGTPFLLVPEVTSVDSDTLEKLVNADEQTLYLSNSSPLGVPIYNLKNSASEAMRMNRIKAGKPGSPCLNKFMAYNTEFSDVPVCTASSQYQSKKIEQLNERNLPSEEHARLYEEIVEKACICHDLGDGAIMKYDMPYNGFKPVPAVCPGPNLVYFSKISSLKEMVDHIYGKINILNANRPRPHVFINEAKLYVDYLRNLILKTSSKMTAKDADYFYEFKKHVSDGIEYYKKISSDLIEESESSRLGFLRELAALTGELEKLTWREKMFAAV